MEIQLQPGRLCMGSSAALAFVRVLLVLSRQLPRAHTSSRNLCQSMGPASAGVGENETCMAGGLFKNKGLMWVSPAEGSLQKQGFVVWVSPAEGSLQKQGFVMWVPWHDRPACFVREARDPGAVPLRFNAVVSSARQCHPRPLESAQLRPKQNLPVWQRLWFALSTKFLLVFKAHDVEFASLLRPLVILTPRRYNPVQVPTRIFSLLALDADCS